MPQIVNKNLSAYRLASIRLVFLVFFIIIAVRLFELQIVDYKFYNALASGQHDILAKLLPTRGEIFTADPLSLGQRTPVAVNRYLNFIYAVPKSIIDPVTTASKLAPLLSMLPVELQGVLGKVDDPYEPVKHLVDDITAQAVKDLNLDGIYILPEVTRYYPEGQLYGQLTGFVGHVGDTKQGQYGIEGFWESILAGQQGELKSEKDVAGRLISLGEHNLTPAEDGADITLTIDKNIQWRACASLKASVKKHGAAGGSLVIMDPKTGAIKAMCGEPTFDPNVYNEVTNQSVFINSAVSVPYEPGSVFKPITMAAALESGNVNPASTYTDTGEVKIGPDIIKNSDFKSHGVQTMTQVLEESLNTGAIFAMRQAGVKAFADFVRKFGFGERTQVELSHEQFGNLETLNKKSEIYYATASFGQGITTTPLQLATAFGAIANKGKLMKPFIVDKISYHTGRNQITEPTFVRQVISPMSAITLGAMLVSVVENGHGKRAGVPGYYVAGKTGTAEIANVAGGYQTGNNIGTFVGFAPVNDPKFVMVVKISEPRDVVFAESSAAPVFGEVAKYLLEYYQVPPSREVK